MTKSRRSGPRGPVVVNGAAVPARPRERIFGGPAPDGPIPGPLLVLLSRLHRAEAEPKDRQEAELG